MRGSAGLTGARGAFSLIELLVVVAVIVLLIAILLPTLSTARALGRQTVCGGNLHALGQAMAAYAREYDDYLPGSPNTSGNGANPGGVGWPVYGGYYAWNSTRDAWPAVHIFDWASPLLAMMVTDVPADIPERYDQSKRWAFRCPANQWRAFLNHASRINIETYVSSYATCRYFTYVPVSRRTGFGPGTLFWSHPFVPDGHFPRLDNLANPSWKVFLADACKIDRGNPQRMSNVDYSYTTHGAWLDEEDVETESPSLSYRFRSGRREAFRHLDGLNMLFFDGHVEHQPDGPSDADEGLGSGARQARFWFPSGTDTGLLPSASAFSNARSIVP
ncbi:MAG: prepilin-type N-terminal cleavage/methylation domain-containing protein [Phycisphaerae bacterium]|nr:prepilin-type N-terminal cleavage/methylation domain-containing protein [Phycisphaerae bacterium]